MVVPPLKKSPGFVFVEVAILAMVLTLVGLLVHESWLDKNARRSIARTKADMRTIATALSAYAVDNPGYPPPWDLTSGGSHIWGTTMTPPFHSRTSGLLTTPVAYMTDIPFDPFRSFNPVFPMTLSLRHTYHNFDYFRAGGLIPQPPAENTFTHATALAGAWLIYSVGPDKDEWNRISFSEPFSNRRVYMDYDPTNGTLSAGNIFHTQKSPDLLGADPYFY
ncbi:MAG: hypothetical protein V2A74_07385 [bacterium]